MITLTNGLVQNCANGTVPNGSISFQLNVDATVIASPYGFVAGNVPVVFQFDENGNILPLTGQSTAQIYSNEELNPQNENGLGTYYLVTFYDANGAQINKTPLWFQFTEDAGSTVDLGMMVPFSTVGGNVIFYPTSFFIGPPGPSTLGGVFSNAGATSEWISAINTDGSVVLSQPSFADISGTISASQLPSPLTFDAITATGLITAESNIQLGVSGTTTGAVTFEGGTSGTATITAPATAGTVGNPFSFSNSINVPSAGVFSINTDTGISRGGAGVLDVGNGTSGNATGTVNAAQYNVAGSKIAATNLSNGTTGTGSIVLATSPTITGTLAAAILTLTTPLAFIYGGTGVKAVTTLTGTADALAFPSVNYVASATADAMTLANPTAGTDDGKIVQVVDTTGKMHTITATMPSASAVDFNGTIGSFVTLQAFNAKWYPLASSGVTIT